MMNLIQQVVRPVAMAISKRTKISPEIITAILTIGLPLVYQAYKSRKQAKTVAGSRRTDQGRNHDQGQSEDPQTITIDPHNKG